MRKIISFIIVLATVLAMVSCGGYDPVESTEEEAETVFNISFGEYEYEVAYELYRTFFLNHKSTVDKGDTSVWSGPDKDQYIEKIDRLILSDICEIYSVFAVCESVGIDIYSDTVEDTIEDYITASVEGGSVDDMVFDGYDGDYDEYLDSLKSLNMNYSVQKLLFRYAICSELLDAYYAPVSEGGTLEFTKDDVKHFYYNDCIRVIKPYFKTVTDLEKEINSLSKMNLIKQGIEARAGDEDNVCTYIITNSGLGEDLRDGIIIGRYNLDESFYGELTRIAFSLPMYGVSDPIQIFSGGTSGYHILYRTEPNAENFEKCYSSIESAYVDNRLGKLLCDTKAALIASAVATSALTDRDRASISMG